MRVNIIYAAHRTMHVRPHMITQNRFVTRVHRARLYRPACVLPLDWLTMLVSVQVCLGIQVLRDWGVLDVNGESTVGALFHGLSTGECESEGFRLEIAYADVSCGISLSQSGKFQSLPLSVKKVNRWHNTIGNSLRCVLL